MIQKYDSHILPWLRRTAAAAVLAGMAFGASGGFMPPAAAQAASSAAAQEIANHFSSVRTMTGEFVQFGPSGEQTGGKFYIQRPGKMRFDYEGRSGIELVSDGESVLIYNPRVKSRDLYFLHQTPLKLLLDERIDLSGGRVTNVREEADLTTITMADKSVFGNSTITMMFDPATNELRQWTITDAQGKDTTVMIFNVQKGVKIDPGLFKIDHGTQKFGQ